MVGGRENDSDFTSATERVSFPTSPALTEHCARAHPRHPDNYISFLSSLLAAPLGNDWALRSHEVPHVSVSRWSCNALSSESKVWGILATTHLFFAIKGARIY